MYVNDFGLLQNETSGRSRTRRPSVKLRESLHGCEASRKPSDEKEIPKRIKENRKSQDELTPEVEEYFEDRIQSEEEPGEEPVEVRIESEYELDDEASKYFLSRCKEKCT